MQTAGCWGVIQSEPTDFLRNPCLRIWTVCVIDRVDTLGFLSVLHIGREQRLVFLQLGISFVCTYEQSVWRDLLPIQAGAGQLLIISCNPDHPRHEMRSVKL